MNYEQALEYIHDTRWRGSRRGLERISLLLEKMGDPQDKLKYVHIAGTNGKGSTSACIASVLKKAGYKTGLYTSPFIERYNERIQINNVPISDDDLARIVTALAPIADSFEDHPTEFEFGTAVAFQYFYEQKCDIVVLEVGMGGEFDATNVIKMPEAAVFTAIGLDHTEYLGPTVSDIAKTKGGIIKEGCTVCSYGGNAEADREIETICAEKNAMLVYAPHNEMKNIVSTLKGSEFDIGDMHISLSLPGTFQPYNAALAVTVLKQLREKGWKITDEHILEGLSSVYWPGRFEVLSENPLFIQDGAHNGHGITAAVKSIKELLPGKKMIFIMGVMADKDFEDMLDLLVPLASEFIAVTPDNPRAMKSDKLAEVIRSHGVKATAYDTIDDGVRAAIEKAGEDEVVFSIGSLYFSADIKNAAKRVLG